MDKEFPSVHAMSFGNSMDMKMGSDLDNDVEGEISIPGFKGSENESSNAEYNTLDEPILLTIKRDLKAVGHKLHSALLPNNNDNILLKEWDLWGPLILCTYIGLMLQIISGNGSSAAASGNGYEFTEVFLIFWLGTTAITYNFIFCHTASMSIFQCICVLGYCLSPLGITVTSFKLMQLFGMFAGTFFLRFLICAATSGWAAFSAIQILGKTAKTEKKMIVLGPIVIFYLLISLLILYHSY